MVKRWERIVALRQRVRKQAEAVLHMHERELGEVDDALNVSPVTGVVSAVELTRLASDRELMLRREAALSRQIAQDKQHLVETTVQAKQVERLRDHDDARARKREDKLEQTRIEDWHQHRRERGQ